MERGGPSSTENDDICVQVDDPTDNCCLPYKTYESQREAAGRTEANVSSSIADELPSGGRHTRIPSTPEKKLTVFALHLAVLEKVACTLGALGFIWATVVLLGGFVSTIDKTDFWYITTILLSEGLRIFSRSHELEWKHHTTLSFAHAGIFSFRAISSSLKSFSLTVRTNFVSCRSSSQQEHHGRGFFCAALPKTMILYIKEAPTTIWTMLLSFGKWACLSRNMSKLLYWLQISSAVTCVTLSLLKLVQHDYGVVNKGDSEKRNRHAALNIFYSLAFSEAILFLMEKAYWEWNIIICKLLEKVNNESGLGVNGIVSIKRFFFDSYTKCVNGSIFDGLKMDLVSFGMELLVSDSSDELLTGIRILQKFATNELYCKYMLQKIGTSISTMENLVEMLNWKDAENQEIRCAAAEILSKLAGEKQNSLRIARIPGVMEAISSLLYTKRVYSNVANEIYRNGTVSYQETYKYSVFNNLGLLILESLAQDHDNCAKIGSTRGLLPKIIHFTHAARLLRSEENSVQETEEIMIVKLSLQVIKMLASTPGTTGKHLRQELSEIVITISNIREILRCGDPVWQGLGIEILSYLAYEEEAKERIGSTGGVLRELFRIFSAGTQDSVTFLAGEALATLAFESKTNCERIVKLDDYNNVVAKLITALKEEAFCEIAARILRNLCAYGELDDSNQKMVISAAPTVVQAILTKEGKTLVFMLGLASQVYEIMSSQGSSTMFEEAGIQVLATKLVETMKQKPSTEVPQIRRFAIELAISIMKDNKENIVVCRSVGMEKELKLISNSMSELESFIVFSGLIGLDRHTTSIRLLVESALLLLAGGSIQECVIETLLVREDSPTSVV